MKPRFAFLQRQRLAFEELSRAEFARWASERRSRVLTHHFLSVFNPAYRTSCGNLTVDLANPEWSALPIIDKRFLREADYASRPACEGRTLLTSTSGTTSTAVIVPQTTRSARTGLGDNFLRALLRGGATDADRHWGIQHQMRQGVATGSQLSMQWLRVCVGSQALVTSTHMSVEAQIAAALSFDPHTISSSPGFLARLVLHEASIGQVHPRIVLFGGSSLDTSLRRRIDECFEPDRIVGFFPTTDAGALGVDCEGDGVYETFSETHWVEILDDEGGHVGVGEVGSLVVTSYDNLAAPLIRYRVGDQVRYMGWKRNRLLLSEINRRAEAPIGDTLLPLSDLAKWTSRLQAVDPTVAAVQFVRQTNSDGTDQPLIRVISAAFSASSRAAALALVNDFPQLVDQLASGDLPPVRVEHVLPEDVPNGIFKMPPYVDERQVNPTKPEV